MMAEDRERDDEVRMPELPPLPELPEAPRLKASLPPRPGRTASEDQSEYRRSGVAYTLPIALVAPIVLLTLGGHWLDQRFGMAPWGTLGGAVLGFIVGMVNMVRMAAKLDGK